MRSILIILTGCAAIFLYAMFMDGDVHGKSIWVLSPFMLIASWMLWALNKPPKDG